VFEIAWGLKSLLPLRDHLNGYDRPVRQLVRFWSPAGVSYTASGMVPNSDDTASALFVLHSVGEPMDTDVLELFEGPEAFYCFPFERNRSVRANAAILEAIRLYDSTPSRRRMTLKLVHYLRESQIEGKYWLDKWHVSPFYATARAVAALAGLDNRVVRAAIEWILAEQHESGMWGVDGGTAEETAYALDSLLAARTSDPAVATLVEAAIERGHARLSEHAGDREHPPLWLGKGLYTPVYVVQAAVVGTLARLELAKASSNPGTVNVG